MKNLAVVLVIVLFSFGAFAQMPKPTRKPISAARNPVGEKDAFERAAALPNATERVTALQKFIKDFPRSEQKTRAGELIFVARATLADEKLRSKDAAGSVELFKLAVRELPKPVSDAFFTEVILQIPNGLYFRGERVAAVEVARLLEEKADGNAKQILALTTFYFATEDAAEAKRLADKAIGIEPNLPAAYQAVGVAHRLNFNLEEAAAAYSKALELDAASAVSKRSLAEMKRALGKPLEAIALYREILSANAADGAARTGLILALFDAENKTEAEAEMTKALAENKNDLLLLVGAAYGYAAHGDAAKAIEFAQNAIIIEPRYTWAHIALARGLTMQKRLPEAEKTLLTARRYGNFPTLDYELATVRLAAGFYRETADELRKSFAVKDGLVTTRLGGRVAANGKSFTELLASERRAGIFQFTAADTSENSERLKALLILFQKLDQKEPDDLEIAEAAEAFVRGDDKMKMHRQLFAAQQLVQRKKALPKVYELAKAAIGGVDAVLDAPNSAAAVLADELYESRKYAVTRGEIVTVPEISRQTLSNILRGRIEDVTGAALLQENKSAEAAVRLKRAVGILPEKSAWWRGSMWRLGAALEADGKSKEALDAYVKSYKSSEADAVKYAVIESVYQKINGNIDGLEAVIGAKPAPVASNSPAQTPIEKSDPAVQPTPEARTQTVAETLQTAPTSNQPTNAATRVESAPITEPKTQDAPIVEKKPETKLPEKVDNQSVENKSKSLFEPIVINVPKTEPVKKPSDENSETRPRLPAEKESVQSCQIIVSEENVSIARGDKGLIVFVSLEGEGDIDVKNLKTTSSDPSAIEISVQPLAEGDSTRDAVFIIKPISRKTGTFTIKFESACGTKEIPVKVR
jgi:tetratricopeptide (TPR) repeat protein